MTKSHILLAIDLGASGTKIIGSFAGLTGCRAVLMAPHCTQIDGILDLDPTYDHNNTWIKIGGDSYAVGNLAQVKYNATNKLKPAKFSTAVPKICAAIAVFYQLFKLDPKFDISISFVLPPAEWSQAAIVIERLQVALKNLATPKGRIQPRLLSITPQPEGMGILLGQDYDLKNVMGIVTVIMLGYRNASVLACTKGVIARPNTCDLGFSDLLKSISGKTGYKIEELIEPIFEYKNKITDNKQQALLALNPLLRCTGVDRQSELSAFIESINNANKEYWKKLIEWLDESMPTQSTVVCVSGGTANYFKSELNLFAQDKMDNEHGRKVQWHTQINPYKKIDLHIDNIHVTNDRLHDRFNDIYILWSELKKQHPMIVSC